MTVFTISGPGTVAETNTGTKAFVFTVTPSVAPVGVPATVDWMIMGIGGAGQAATTDFDAATPLGATTLNFGVGVATPQQVTILVNGDSVVEPDELFTVTLQNPTNATVGAAGTATATIQNDDSLVKVTALAAAFAEGSSATANNIVVTLTRTGATAAAATVDWTVAGTGANPVDLNDFFAGALPTGTATFAAGSANATVTLAVKADSAVEMDEELIFTLTAGGPGVEIDTTAKTTTTKLTNDDSEIGILAVVPAAQNEGAAGATTNYVFEITRSAGALTAAQIVPWAVTGTGANPANAADFGGTLPSGSVTFGVGEMQKFVTIAVKGDVDAEPSEEFTLTLTAPQGVTLRAGDESETATITNDDLAPSFAIAATDASKPEGAAGTTNYTFTITRSANTAGVNAVTWTAAGSGASPAAADDFATATGTATFTAGQTTALVTVGVKGDQVFEANEDFTVTLSAPTNGAVIGTATAAGVIQTDESRLKLAAPTVTTIDEGNTGSTQLVFTVNRDGLLTQTSTVKYEIVANTAAGNAGTDDFAGGKLPSGTLTFASGDSAQTFLVEVAGDTKFEPDEAFTVKLSGASTGTTIDAASETKTVTIRNDDVATVVSIAAVQADRFEGTLVNGAMIFSVTRAGPTTQETVVTWTASTTGGTGQTDANDFTATTGKVTFAPGQTAASLVVNAKADALVESDESFTVSLSAPTNGASLGTATASGIIRNDDFPTSLAIAPINADRPEGQSGLTPFTFQVTRTGQTARQDVVNWSASFLGGRGQANLADFTDFAGTLTFTAGETMKTLVVGVRGDVDLEGDESFVVALSGQSADVGLVTPAALGVIRTDEIIAVGATTTGGSSRDRFVLGPGSDVVTGGLGTDAAAIAASRGFTTVTWNGVSGEGGRATVTGAQGTDQLIGVERIEYTDGTLALDIDGAAGQAFRLFDAALDRVPDPAGLAFYVAQLDAGASLRSVADSFIGSAEFQRLYGTPTTLSNTQFITQLYLNVLGRAPDAAGLAFWNGQLTAGRARADVLTQFSESGENRAILAPQVQNGIFIATTSTAPDTAGRDVFVLTNASETITGGANLDAVLVAEARAAVTTRWNQGTGDASQVTLTGTLDQDILTGVERIQLTDGIIAFDAAGNAGQAFRLYQAALGRAPDAAGLGFFVRQLDSGTSLRTVADQFIGSPEFQARFRTTDVASNQQFVNLMYANVLGRDPDAGGLAFWTNRLDSGVARGDVLINFSESAENQAVIQPRLVDGIFFV